MSNGLILAIDQGTTNTKALAVDGNCRVVAEASAPMSVDYPRSGWAEQSATGIWDSVARVIADVVATTRQLPSTARALVLVVPWSIARIRPLLICAR